jgi:hypothetical protein
MCYLFNEIIAFLRFRTENRNSYKNKQQKIRTNTDSYSKISSSPEKQHIIQVAHALKSKLTSKLISAEIILKKNNLTESVFLSAIIRIFIDDSDVNY